jgi:Zn ribbon nucleic-acid-binding protein
MSVGSIAGSSCPLCGSTNSKAFPIYYTLREKRFDARECASCGFVYVAPKLTPDELAFMYSDDYFLHDGADSGAHSSTDYETAARRGSVKFPVVLGAIKKYVPSGKYLEIGTGMGHFLKYAHDNGYDTFGVEFSELGAKHAQEKLGLNVVRSSFEDYAAPPESFDVIFMGDVLEHFVEPKAQLERAYSLIRKGGAVACEVPGMFNTLVGRAAVMGYRLMNHTKKMPMPPYHVSEFMPDTLRKIYLDSGFEKVIIIQRIRSPKVITLRGSVMEKLLKRAIHYPNYALTKTLGVFGDRLLAIGIK